MLVATDQLVIAQIRDWTWRLERVQNENFFLADRVRQALESGDIARNLDESLTVELLHRIGADPETTDLILRGFPEATLGDPAENIFK